MYLHVCVFQCLTVSVCVSECVCVCLRACVYVHILYVCMLVFDSQYLQFFPSLTVCVYVCQCLTDSICVFPSLTVSVCMYVCQCLTVSICVQVICLRDRPQKILGMHIVGPNAGEIMQGFAVAMRFVLLVLTKVCVAYKTNCNHCVQHSERPENT